MPIELDDQSSGPRSPVLRRRRLGEAFLGVLVRTDRRQQIKDNVPQTKPDGRPKNELVVTMLALPGTTMNAGLGDNESVPEPGDTVRAILKGGGYGAWIEADQALKPRQVGDVVLMTSDYAQVYDADGRPTGERLTDQGSLDAVPRGRSVGVYGSVAIRRPGAEEASWVTKAEEAYLAAEQAQRTQLPTVDPDEVFAAAGQAPAPQPAAQPAPAPGAPNPFAGFATPAA